MSVTVIYIFEIIAVNEEKHEGVIFSKEFFCEILDGKTLVNAC